MLRVTASKTPLNTVTRGSNIIKNAKVDYSLQEGRERFCNSKNASIFITSFNVNKKCPPVFINHWLIFDTNRLPDFVVIGLQEIGTYVFESRNREEQWLQCFKKNLHQSYEIIEKVRLIGIFMVIFQSSTSSIPKPITSFKSRIATGYLNFGNKGGVGISFDILDTSVCFVNCHLAAGDQLTKRNQDFRKISQMRFGNGRQLYDHDIVFWLGDLNYRLDTFFTHASTIKMIENGNINELQKCDQLQKQQASHQAFGGFKEPLGIPFPPTYKFDIGTSRWDTSKKRRIPAWCDRILFKTKDARIRIFQHEYYSVEEVFLSDHKPVIASFLIGAKIMDKEKKKEE